MVKHSFALPGTLLLFISYYA
uniref:Uncharacterized protein n=1 Tax=Arundo donax TaxID=35708 RepID=A0A0A9HES7_ARUDO